MNLHIGVDNQFIERVIDNLDELGIRHNNRFIIRTAEAPRHVRHAVDYAPLYSPAFRKIVGDTQQYERVIIHQFSPLMFRWVASHSFHCLDWATWGSDLYGLPFIDFNQYEPETFRRFIAKRRRPLAEVLYDWKYRLTNAVYRDNAYAKITSVLTWMKGEHSFANTHIPALRAAHEFFFYENPVPYHELNQYLQRPSCDVVRKRIPRLIVGNSATPTNNHLDVVRFLSETGMQADLIIPVSYGDADYKLFLQGALAFYKGGKLEFIEQRIDFRAYLNMMNSADALVMNNLRPQGYGNIFMMLYLGKPVFLNPGNVSIPDLTANRVPWRSINELRDFSIDDNVEIDLHALTALLSHERSLQICTKLFS